MYLAAFCRILEGMHTGGRWRLGHRPGLDGLRGVAIVLVLICHVVEHQWPNALGSAGVTVFFTLSGFLITSLLLEEFGGRGSVSWSGFYRRRALRLFPALAVMLSVIGSFLVTANLIDDRAFLWVVTYLANWSGFAGVAMGPLSHMWSLAIEEQFYVVWPLALVITRRWRHGPLVVAGVGIAISIVLRFALWDGGAGSLHVARGSDTRMDALLVGCALAIALASGMRFRVSPAIVLGASCAALAAIVLSPEHWSAAVVAPTVIPWVTVLGLLYALTSPRPLTVPALRWFGRRSYGIYLWHYPVIYCTALATGSMLAGFVALGCSLLIAEASWRFVEQPILQGQLTRKKSKYPATSVVPFSATT